jgi:hypothetical protein
LSRQRYQVNQALAVSEVFSLAQQHQSASMIITPDVEQARAKVIQQHWPALHLTRAVTVQDILWGLSVKGATLQ